MISPDANAFVAGILAEPADRLRRLVFADWLDEQGGESNAAWAGYLRTQAELEASPADDPRTVELKKQADYFGDRTQVRLTLPARAVKTRFLHLVRTLPPRNVTVRLNRAQIQKVLLDSMPESATATTRFFPVGREDSYVAVVTPSPRSDLFAFIGNIVAFHGHHDEVVAALTWYWGLYPYRSPVIRGAPY